MFGLATQSLAAGAAHNAVPQIGARNLITWLFVAAILLALPGVYAVAGYVVRFVNIRATPERDETQIQRKRKLLTLLVATAFLVLLAYIVGWSEQPFLLSRHDSELREFLGDLLFAFATAAMVSLTFSRVLDLPDVSDHIVRQLRSVLEEDRTKVTEQSRTDMADLMFGDKYLRSIKATERIREVRRKLDQMIYGGQTLDDKESLYNFVAGQVNDQYSQSYRRNIVIQVNCRRLADCLEWEETRAYSFMRNPLDTGTEPEVQSRTTDQLTEAWMTAIGKSSEEELLQATLLDASLLVGSASVGFISYALSEDKRTLVLQSNTGVFAIPPPQTIDIHCEPIDKYLIWRYGYSFSFPEELRRQSDVKVESLVRRKKPIRDDMYYLDLRRPSKNVLLTCHFPDDIRIELGKFALSGHDDQSLDEGRPHAGYGLVRIEGWTLPGHGICLTWHGFGSDHIAPPALTPAMPAGEQISAAEGATI